MRQDGDENGCELLVQRNGFRAVPACAGCRGSFQRDIACGRSKLVSYARPVGVLLKTVGLHDAQDRYRWSVVKLRRQTRGR
jgi:hypothetical protein